MNNTECGYKCLCVSIAVIASIIIGIITALLTITGIITLTPAFLLVAFGIAIVYLAAVAFTDNRSSFKSCICTILTVLLVGILGTIFASLILLAIDFAATSIIGALVAGALLTFFSLIITSTACLAARKTDCDD